MDEVVSVIFECGEGQWVARGGAGRLIGSIFDVVVTIVTVAVIGRTCNLRFCLLL